MLRARVEYYDTKEHILQLWIHEAFRVFGDRMWDANDKLWLQETTTSILKNAFNLKWAELFPQGVPPFVSFLSNVDNPPYEVVRDLQKLKVKIQILLCVRKNVD